MLLVDGRADGAVVHDHDFEPRPQPLRRMVQRMFHRKRTSSPFASSDLAATATIIIASEQAEGVVMLISGSGSMPHHGIFGRTMGLVRAIQRPLTTTDNVDRTTDMPPGWVEGMDGTLFN